MFRLIIMLRNARCSLSRSLRPPRATSPPWRGAAAPAMLAEAVCRATLSGCLSIFVQSACPLCPGTNYAHVPLRMLLFILQIDDVNTNVIIHSMKSKMYSVARAKHWVHSA